jgi:predicted DNA-binding transcriptional regulator AlpA
METTPNPSVRLLSPPEVAGLLGISIRKLWKLKAEQQLPKPIKVGRCTRWRDSDITAFINSL